MERMRAVFPFGAVILPWIVARLLVVPVMIFRSPHGGGTYPQWLLVMDGGWFRLIALDWYDRHDGIGGISEYPFFPLFPRRRRGLDAPRLPVDGRTRRPRVDCCAPGHGGRQAPSRSVTSAMGPVA